MHRVYNINQNKFIVYSRNQNNPKTHLCVIFLHGLLSNMNGTKALYLEQYCASQGYDFIRFDNFGHGNSSGDFLQETISSWLEGIELIINQLTINQDVILIGSSMGGWIALLAAIKYPKKIKGLICLAPAPDFTEDLIWGQLPQIKQQQMQEKGWIEISGDNPTSQKYPISYNLIIDAKNHLLLNKDNIKISAPVHLIHGMLDADVPYSLSQTLCRKIISDNVVLKLIKDDDHRLSRDKDLKIITNSVEEIINLY